MEKTPISNIQVEKRRKPFEEESPRISRRNLFTSGGSAAVLAVVGKNAFSYNNTAHKKDYESVEETEVNEEFFDDAEMITEDLSSPNYEKVLAVRTIEAGGLRRDQVIFTDEYGRQITEPFDLSPFLGLDVEEMVWRYQAGVAKGIPGGWITDQKKYISGELGIPISRIQMHHVYLDLDSTRAERMNSRVELVYANATTPVETDIEGRDPLTILRTEIKFTKLSPHVVEQLTPFLVGIASEESRFDANKKNKNSGASGIFQTMPWVVEKYKKEHNEPNLDASNLEDQLKVSVEHIEVTYRELTENLNLELAYIARVYFGGNMASMEKYFLVPLMIGSYNTGQDRIIDVVTWFLETYPEPESTAELLGQSAMLTGYDVFFAMVYQCAKEKGVDRFGAESSVYVSKVMGWTKAFIDYEKNQKQPEIQRANNN